jgi:hypothetical protein
MITDILLIININVRFCLYEDSVIVTIIIKILKNIITYYLLNLIILCYIILIIININI